MPFSSSHLGDFTPRKVTAMTNDSTRRSLRTGIDAMLTIITALLTMLVYPGLPELLDDALGRPGATASIGIISGALLLFFTKVRNALEDRGSIPALLKAPASDGAHPVPGAEDGHTDVLGVALVALIVVVILVLLGVIR